MLRPHSASLFPYTTLFRSTHSPKRRVMAALLIVLLGGLVRADEKKARTDAHGDALPERSEEHTSELQSPCKIVCRLLLEKKKKLTQDDGLFSRQKSRL